MIVIISIEFEVVEYLRLSEELTVHDFIDDMRANGMSDQEIIEYDSFYAEYLK